MVENAKVNWFQALYDLEWRNDMTSMGICGHLMRPRGAKYDLELIFEQPKLLHDQ